MLDAYGRIPQAITQGNTLDIGTFDQCLNIFENLEVGEIRGKYCYGGLILQMVDMELKPPVPSSEVRLYVLALNRANG